MARILIVDDDEHLRAGLRLTLRSTHEVVEASGGDEALRICRENPIDLVLTDILMPDKDGLEVILTLRREIPNLKVIAMSGGFSSGSGPNLPLKSARDLGAVEILEKPFEPQQLFAAIDKTLKS